jgi:hypothetical protein
MTWHMSSSVTPLLDGWTLKIVAASTFIFSEWDVSSKSPKASNTITAVLAPPLSPSHTVLRKDPTMSFCFTQLQQRPVLTSGFFFTQARRLRYTSFNLHKVSNEVHFTCDKVGTGSSTR